MRIAILGAGFCGLAAAWHLSEDKRHQITLFDPLEIGKGTSGIAAGLLHGYAGAHAKQSWHALEGLTATLKLLKIAESTLQTSVMLAHGLTRFAITPQQVHDFAKCACTYPDAIWRTADENLKIFPDAEPYPGIFIENALAVNCPLYLKGLWQACQKRGVCFEQSKITSMGEVANYDCSIVAMGAASLQLKELAHLPIKPIKGQLLELEWPQGLPSLPHPLNSQAYLLMNPGHKACIAGATFEREFLSEAPDKEFAYQEIMAKITSFLPPLAKAKVLDCRAGVRASAPHHRPLLLQLTDKCWVIGGMGSKGLLYHALLAEELAKKITQMGKQ